MELWKEAGAEGEVTERECRLGRLLAAMLKAPGFMAFKVGSREGWGRMSAKPF